MNISKVIEYPVSFEIISEGTSFYAPKFPGNRFYQEVMEWQESGGVIEQPAPPSNDQLILDMTKRLEAWYDSKAQEKRYDNRYTCALRAGYEGPFKGEGVAFAQWMDACNVIGYQVIEEVLQNIRPIPTFEELVQEMPTLVWPN